MSPEARMELDRSRIRRESRERDRQFARPVDTGFTLGVILGVVAAALIFVWWLHG